MYGKLLTLDLHGCDPRLFTASVLINYVEALADLTDMVVFRHDLWRMAECPPEWQDSPHLNGISSNTWINTSNITIHALFDGRLYLDLFTCKDFEPDAVKEFTETYWRGSIVGSSLVDRH